MSRTDDVSRALSAVFTCGPPDSASVRSDISGRAGRHPSYDRLSTCAACQGCTGSNSRPPSRSSSGHCPDTRQSSAGTGIVPSSTSGACSGPYASCSATEKPGRDRQPGWNGCPSVTRRSHSQSRPRPPAGGIPSGHSSRPRRRAPARDSASEATLCASSATNPAAPGPPSAPISRAGSSYRSRSRCTAVTYAAVAYGSACGPCSRRPSDRRTASPHAPDSRPVTNGSGSYASARHSRVSTAARAPGSSAA